MILVRETETFFVKVKVSLTESVRNDDTYMVVCRGNFLANSYKIFEFVSS